MIRFHSRRASLDHPRAQRAPEGEIALIGERLGHVIPYYLSPRKKFGGLPNFFAVGT